MVWKKDVGETNASNYSVARKRGYGNIVWVLTENNSHVGLYNNDYTTYYDGKKGWHFADWHKDPLFENVSKAKVLAFAKDWMKAHPRG